MVYEITVNTLATTLDEYYPSSHVWTHCLTLSSLSFGEA